MDRPHHGSRPFTLEAEGSSPVVRGPRSIDLGFTVVEDSAANSKGDGGKEPAHSSGIFSTSDFSVDPPLPVHSSSSSTQRSEPRSHSEGAGELNGGAGQFFGNGGGAVQQQAMRSPRASHGGVEHDSAGSIASLSGTSSDNGGGGGRAWENDDGGSLLRAGGSRGEGLGSTPSSTPAAAVPPRYPGGGGSGDWRDSFGGRRGRAGKRGGGSSSNTSGSAFSEEGSGNGGGESGQEKGSRHAVRGKRGGVPWIGRILAFDVQQW